MRLCFTSVDFFDDQGTVSNNTKLDPFSKLSYASCGDALKHFFVSFKASTVLPSFGISYLTYVWLWYYSIFSNWSFSSTNLRSINISLFKEYNEELPSVSFYLNLFALVK